MRALFALLFALLAGAAHAQVTPGTSPLSGAKGGTNNAFMQFSGPAGSLKTYTVPNVTGTLAMLSQIQTWTGGQSFTDGTVILLGSSSGSSTLKAPASGGGTATLFAGSDTIMGVASAQTPTNKTFVCANQTSCVIRIASDVSGLGTGIATALGVNVGTAGSLITNGGALGSPSSAGTLPAHTLGGTVAGGGNQINNVIIGASTPLAGSFTTASLGNSVSNGLFFKSSGGSNDAQMYEGSGGIRVDLLGTVNAWEMATNGAASVVADYNVTTASTYTLTPNVAMSAGLTIGAPTGGNKGAGTINIAGAFYANGVAVTGTGTVTSVTCGTGLSGGTITGSGTCAVNLSALTNSLGADVALSNTASYFDGPSVAQGTSGTWWASGTVTLTDTGTAAQFHCRLWDGTSVIASGGSTNLSAGTPASIALSGYLAAPAANIKISCRDTSSTSGKILFNQTGNSKDSTISVHRIQ